MISKLNSKHQDITDVKMPAEGSSYTLCIVNNYLMTKNKPIYHIEDK